MNEWMNKMTKSNNKNTKRRKGNVWNIYICVSKVNCLVNRKFLSWMELFPCRCYIILNFQAAKVYNDWAKEKSQPKTKETHARAHSLNICCNCSEFCIGFFVGCCCCCCAFFGCFRLSFGCRGICCNCFFLPVYCHYAWYVQRTVNIKPNLSFIYYAKWKRELSARPIWPCRSNRKKDTQQQNTERKKEKERSQFLH